jgi:hypothetical protein
LPQRSCQHCVTVLIVAVGQKTRAMRSGSGAAATACCAQACWIALLVATEALKAAVELASEKELVEQKPPTPDAVALGAISSCTLMRKLPYLPPFFVPVHTRVM